MRAYSWMVLGALALACGGSAFTSGGSEPGGEGGSGDEAGTAGVLGKAGRGSGGSVIGSGGKVGVAGMATGGTGTGGGISVGGFGIAGDLIAGGSFPIAGGPGTGGTGPDPEPVDEACPKTIPATGGLCAEGLSCSYGTDIRAWCRMRAKCDGGKWAIYEPADDCPTLHACNDNVIGGSCDAQVANPCIKDQKLYCACVSCVGGACSTGTWQCEGVNTQGCPAMVPNEGQMCEGQAQCSYGNCAVGNPMDVTCNGATWGWETLGCVNN